ncbi:MAG: tetratricopeptide repeat protein [Terracidiphilus sp.]|jgi:tetratricopeptide (TPR) repeat protein
MRRLMMMLAITCLLLGAAPYGRTDPVTDATKASKMEQAKKAEERGDVARARKDNALAASYYLTALRVDRQNSDVYNKLGMAEVQLSEYGSARKHFTLAVKYDPQSSVALNNLGAVALIEKKYKAALAYFKQALALDESNATVHINLAETWVGLYEMDRAMTEYARALELDADVLSSDPGGISAQIASPEQRARVSFMVAKAYAKRGNVDGALEYLRRAKELRYPDLAKVYTDQDFSPLWKDPRLAKIIKR